MNRNEPFTLYLLTLFCAGCTIHSPNEQLTRQSVGDVPPAWHAEASGDTVVQNGWITEFKDQVLETLVQEAQRNNRDLQASVATVEQARALARQAGAELFPAVDLTLDSQRQDFTGLPTTTAHEAGLRASWELDVWGRVRSSRHAAHASAEAAAADLIFARDSLAAAVAQAYFVAIDAGVQETITRQSEKNLQQITDLLRLQVQEGVALHQDLLVSESDLATVRSQWAGVEGARRDALRALELLLGRYPGAELTVPEELPPAPAGPSAGLPSQLLERRPDLIAAERRIAAAFHSLQEARAARLPRFSLTGLLGGASSTLSSVLNSESRNESLVAGLLAPIFQGGALAAEVERANAEQRAAIAGYGQAALEAFRDVESALDAGEILTRQEAELSTALTTAEEAFRIARLRFEHGDIDLFDLLSVEQRVFERKLELSGNRREVLEQRVGLFLALGGPWSQ